MDNRVRVFVSCSLAALVAGTGCGGPDLPPPFAPPTVGDPVPPGPGQSGAVELPLLDYYPAPRALTIGAAGPVVDRVCVNLSGLPVHGRLDALLPELTKRYGLVPLPAKRRRDPPWDRSWDISWDCPWDVVLADSSAALSDSLRAALAAAPDSTAAFAVETRGHHTRIVARTEAAARDALMAAFSLTAPVAGGRRLWDGSLVDWPDSSLRGIIEGFYGPPYSLAERTDVLARMALARQNTYLYGPQNDDFAHGRWAEPYPEAEAQALAASVTYARARFIEPIWAFRPAPNAFGYSQPDDSIRFSSDADFQRVVGKLESMHALGFARFGLFIDDSKEGLYWPEDQQAFASPAEAHAALANRLQAWLRALDPSASLIFVGNKYTRANDGWETYNATLGQRLDPAILVLWTGNQTYSATIESGDLTAIDSLLGRRVAIWDNSPSLPLALSGRSADLPSAVAGFLSNAVMNEWRYHSVAEFESIQGTLGAYDWNAARYRPAQALSWWSALSPP